MHKRRYVIILDSKREVNATSDSGEDMTKRRGGCPMGTQGFRKVKLGCDLQALRGSHVNTLSTNTLSGE